MTRSISYRDYNTLTELSLYSRLQSSNMMIIFITAILGLQTTAEAWSFFRLPGESEASKTHICFSRSPKSHTSDFLTLPMSGNKIIPRVPHRSRGLEHKDDGRSKDWTFDQKRLRPLGYNSIIHFENFYISRSAGDLILLTVEESGVIPEGKCPQHVKLKTLIPF